MKKKILFIAVFAVILLITGCGKKKAKEYKLVVSSIDWSGWTEDYKGTKVNEEFNVKEGKKYTIRKDDGYSITIEIKKLSDKSITFKTSEGLSENGSLLDYSEEFTIDLDESIDLNTVTMDAGCSYTITFKK